MSIRQKLEIIKIRTKWHVMLYSFAGRELAIEISIAKFTDRKSALACRDRIYEAIGAPF